MASLRPADGLGSLFTGYTHDFYVRRVYGRNVGRRHDRDVMPGSAGIPLAARLACAKLTSELLVIAAERKRHGVDDPDPYRNLRRTRDQRLSAGRVLGVQYPSHPARWGVSPLSYLVRRLGVHFRNGIAVARSVPWHGLATSACARAPRPASPSPRVMGAGP